MEKAAAAEIDYLMNQELESMVQHFLVLRGDLVVVDNSETFGYLAEENFVLVEE